MTRRVVGRLVSALLALTLVGVQPALAGIGDLDKANGLGPFKLGRRLPDNLRKYAIPTDKYNLAMMVKDRFKIPLNGNTMRVSLGFFHDRLYTIVFLCDDYWAMDDVIRVFTVAYSEPLSNTTVLDATGCTAYTSNWTALHVSLEVVQETECAQSEGVFKVICTDRLAEAQMLAEYTKAKAEEGRANQEQAKRAEAERLEATRKALGLGTPP